jgi:type IV secretory pathway VirB2 component (pilin)
MLRRITLFIFCTLPTLCFASQQASNSWEVVLKKISESLTGPVTYFLGVIAVFICGMAIVFTDIQNGGQRFVNTAIGIGLSFGAVAALRYFGVSGALI